MRRAGRMLSPMITGLLKPARGSILLNEAPVRLGDRRIALVPQEYAFYPRLSGRENLNYFAGVQGLTGKAAKQAVDHVLAQCALTSDQHQRAAQYSGGLKRRLNFAIALLARPQLLILGLVALVLLSLKRRPLWRLAAVGQKERLGKSP